MHDLEIKMRNFEIKFQDQSDMFNNVKKDMFGEIYENNQNANNKFQMVNETIIEKLDKYDISFTNFQNILVVSVVNLNTLFRMNTKSSRNLSANK